MGLDDLAADGEAEAGGFFAAGRLDGETAEILEELVALAFWDAFALVADTDGVGSERQGTQGDADC